MFFKLFCSCAGVVAESEPLIKHWQHPIFCTIDVEFLIKGYA